MKETKARKDVIGLKNGAGLRAQRDEAQDDRWGRQGSYLWRLDFVVHFFFLVTIFYWSYFLCMYHTPSLPPYIVVYDASIFLDISRLA